MASKPARQVFPPSREVSITCRTRPFPSGVSVVRSSIVPPSCKGISPWKRDYIRYFRLVYPKIRPGGAIFAHNVLSHGKEMRDFLTAIGNHPSLDTHIDRRSRAGLSVSIKRQ